MINNMNIVLIIIFILMYLSLTTADTTTSTTSNNNNNSGIYNNSLQCCMEETVQFICQQHSWWWRERLGKCVALVSWLVTDMTLGVTCQCLVSGVLWQATGPSWHWRCHVSVRLGVSCHVSARGVGAGWRQVPPLLPTAAHTCINLDTHAWT